MSVSFTSLTVDCLSAQIRERDDAERDEELGTFHHLNVSVDLGSITSQQPPHWIQLNLLLNSTSGTVENMNYKQAIQLTKLKGKLFQRTPKGIKRPGALGFALPLLTVHHSAPEREVKPFSVALSLLTIKTSWCGSNKHSNSCGILYMKHYYKG